MTVDAGRALATMPSHDGPVSPRDPSFLRSILSGTLSQRQEKESYNFWGDVRKSEQDHFWLTSQKGHKEDKGFPLQETQTLIVGNGAAGEVRAETYDG